MHAKHRLFQLHLLRYVAKGNLSTLIGSPGVQLDQYLRIMGVVRALDARMDSLTPEERIVLTNYAAGVNKVVEELKVYPVEFQLLFTRFERWTIRDSVAC